MRKDEVIVRWDGGMAFDAAVGSHHVMVDARSEHGGSDKGPSPKPMMLTAMGGCTGMDVASLLKKMRVDVEGFEIGIEAELTDEHPKYYRKVHLDYRFTGRDLDEDKIRKAVELSFEKYCGVIHMFKSFADVSYEINVLQEAA